MADLPVPFTAPMVRALVRRTKTQTRRIITSLNDLGSITEFGPSTTHGYEWHFRDKGQRWHDLRHEALLGRSRYRAGDRLWVREAWRTEARYDPLPPSNLPAVALISYEADYDQEPNDGCRGRFRHARYIPRWASRLTLTVTDIRVERLQDISDADAEAKGIIQIGPPSRNGRRHFGLAGEASIDQPTARHAYRQLWEIIRGPEAWAANPWLIAIGFAVTEGNIDLIGGQAHG